MQRCSNCNQPMLGTLEGEPCGRCGHLDGLDLLDELPEGDPTEASTFRSLVWWMAMVFVAGIMVGVVWIMLRFQSSLVNMTQNL